MLFSVLIEGAVRISENLYLCADIVNWGYLQRNTGQIYNYVADNSNSCCKSTFVWVWWFRFIFLLTSAFTPSKNTGTKEM